MRDEGPIAQLRTDRGGAVTGSRSGIATWLRQIGTHVMPGPHMLRCGAVQPEKGVRFEQQATAGSGNFTKTQLFPTLCDYQSESNLKATSIMESLASAQDAMIKSSPSTKPSRKYSENARCS